MSQSGDVAETMARMYLQGFEVGLRVTGAGGEKILALILATMKDKRKTAVFMTFATNTAVCT